MKINEVWGRKPKSTPQASWVDIAKELPVSAKKGTAFQQQFQIVDTDPVTVQWKNQHFQRKDGTGDWVNFPAGKPVSAQMSAALDKVSPPEEPQQAQPARKPISITDHQGQVFSFNDSDRKWYGPGNVEIIDPVSIKKLNKAAEVQFQNRQMSA